MPREFVTYIALANHRAKPRPFGIKRRDRRSHLYMIGKTGAGKSTLLKTLIAQDISAGEGLALLDPHGDLASEVRSLVPRDRERDLIYLDVPNPTFSWFFNPFSGVPPQKRALAAAGLIDVFKKLWTDEWGPRLEHLLRNVIFVLLETPGATLGDVPKLLLNNDYRKETVSQVENEEARHFFEGEFAGYSYRFRAVVTAPLLNKVGAFLGDPLLKRILTGKESSLDLRKIMDDGKVLLVNLAKGRIGEGPSGLLGALLVSHLSLLGLSRAETPEESRRDFYVYLDEFQTFSTLTLATMLSELRKYRVNLILANQYFGQLNPEIRDAVLGNVGTLISFRVGAQDAPLLSREFAPAFTAEDLVNLPNYQVYLRLMIDGEMSRAFSAQTFGPSEVPPGFNRS